MRQGIMRTLCDVCESAAAILFCPADEAALCQSCDDQVHLCNKLASRHVRVKLADPSGVGSCDICENAPAFFYCEVDGSNLCLQCDISVHVGGKRTHGRYLLFRQRVEFPRDKPGHLEELTLQHVDPGEVRTGQTQTTNVAPRDRVQNHGTPNHNNHEHGKMETKMIDLNARPNLINGQASNSQVQSLDTRNGYCDSAIAPRGAFNRDPE